jgi:hypothetical protein
VEVEEEEVPEETTRVEEGKGEVASWMNIIGVFIQPSQAILGICTAIRIGTSFSKFHLNEYAIKEFMLPTEAS